MTNTEITKASKSTKGKAVVVVEGQTGTPVGIEAAADAIKSGAGIMRDVLADRVRIVSGLVASNDGISKSKLFEALMTAIGDEANVSGAALSVASLYRYATIGGLITGHGLPITADTVKAAYPLTEGKRGNALKAVTSASKAQTKSPEAFSATVGRAIAAADKASAPSAPVESVPSVSAKRQTVSAWAKSLTEYVESAPEADRVKISKALTAALATVTPVPVS